MTPVATRVEMPVMPMALAALAAPAVLEVPPSVHHRATPWCDKKNVFFTGYLPVC